MLKNAITMVSRRAEGQVVPQRGEFTFTLSFFCAIILSSSLLFVSALTPIPSASWHDFIAECLDESDAEVTGECTAWASGNNYGTMPNK